MDRLYSRVGQLIVVSSAILMALSGCQQQSVRGPSTVPSTAAPAHAMSVTPTVFRNVTVDAQRQGSPATAGAEPQILSHASPTEPSQTSTPQPAIATSTPGPPGALINVSMQSEVGVLLDEIPVELRERVATSLMSQSKEVWLARAIRQVRLTRLRLNFRNFVYEGNRGQLPLPPSDLWEIQLDSTGPSRQIIQGHELIMIAYTFDATILTDEESPAVSEPALADVGGVWREPFVFPADPDLLLQRTGNACVNEGGFPPDSYDSENIWHLYDFECTADSGGAAGCHRLFLPSLSCIEALAARVGEVHTSLRFERLAWDAALADQVRTGPHSGQPAPDLMVVAGDLGNHRIAYRFFESDDCALQEGAVGASGWRRLLLFDATVHNIGRSPLHIGSVIAEDLNNNVFEYNTCHDHFHYTNYGDFYVDIREPLTGTKQAFCVQSTDRRSNHESSPIVHEYSCRFQGIQAGWVDEYIAGLDTQWIDITDLKLPAGVSSVQLGFRSNSDRFLCEGSSIVDDNGQQVWEPSGFTTDEGEEINRPACDFISDWDANNLAVYEVAVPEVGSYVTQPCQNDEIGPLRNCGFHILQPNEIDPLCRPGESVAFTMRLDMPEVQYVLRICERSAMLATGVACTYEESITNLLVGESETSVSFSCPRVRDAPAENLGGGYAMYLAPVWPDDPIASPIMPDSG